VVGAAILRPVFGAENGSNQPSERPSPKREESDRISVRPSFHTVKVAGFWRTSTDQADPSLFQKFSDEGGRIFGGISWY
jgi:hypothetical protein